MKNKFFLVLICLLLCGCGAIDFWSVLCLWNFSDITIEVFAESNNDSVSIGEVHAIISPHTNEDVLWDYDDDFLDILYKKYNADTLCWIVVDSATGLELQRYMMSLFDAKRLSNTPADFSFPPNLKMRNIKMWPPYGTYDANFYNSNGY